MANWGFLTNHAHVLIHVARTPRSTGREIALATGITERAAISVLQDLRRAALLIAHRDGRQNTYKMDLVALAKHRPWGTSDMDIPQTLVDATVEGLRRVAASGVCVFSESHAPSAARRRWGFLTTHALILIHITCHPRATVREIALAARITERATLGALQDLWAFDIVERQRHGRRNSYTVNFGRVAAFRREGTDPDLVPDPFISSLVDGLLMLRPAQ